MGHPEDANIEIAHKLSEPKDKDRRPWEEVVEAVEVALLAIIAVATAWTGYEAARWDGLARSATGRPTRHRFAADAASTLAGQRMVGERFDVHRMARGQAHGHGAVPEGARAPVLARVPCGVRCLAHDRPGPQSGGSARPWLHAALSAIPGMEEARRLNELATATFEEGTRARETADRYVSDAVRFATVLFVVGIAQRFRVRKVRIAAMLLASAFLTYVLVAMLRLPRL